MKKTDENEINQLEQVIIKYINDNFIKKEKNEGTDDELLISVDELIGEIDTIYWYEKISIGDLNSDSDSDSDLDSESNTKIKKNLETIKKYNKDMIKTIARAKINQKIMSVNYVYFMTETFYDKKTDEISIEIIQSPSLSDLLKYVVPIDTIKSILERNN